MEYRIEGTKRKNWIHEWQWIWRKVDVENMQEWRKGKKLKYPKQVYNSSWSKCSGKKQNEVPVVKKISGMC